MINKIETTKYDWHSFPRDEVLQILQTRKSGLTDREVVERQNVFGLNEIKEEKPISALKIFAKQFKNFLIVILLVATIISLWVGESIDAFVIFAIVILATIVGFVQEYRSEKAIIALKKMAAATIRVIRNDEEKIINVKDLVPGDIILVSVGDRIPADAFLIEDYDLQTNEAPLTGESLPVRKHSGVLPEETAVADRKNILYMITTVTHGRAKAVVCATGMKTELGKIASAVQSIELKKSPFEIRMQQLGKTISLLMIGLVGIISFIGFFRGNELLEMLIWGISLAVAAIPEALPAVVVASLTVGVYRMAKKHAIVRRLPAIETLGSTTIVCSDKTGTLTKGEMTVRKIYLYDKFANVSGSGYSSEGTIEGLEKNNPDLILLAKTASLCNDAKIKLSNKENLVVGDPTEGALIVFANKVGLIKESLDTEFPRLSEIQFSSERKKMTTVNRVDHSNFAFMKGATESVIKCCTSLLSDNATIPLDENKRKKILQITDDMAGNGLRVLAFAYKKMDSEEFDETHSENNLTFIGLVGMMDPPRPEVIDAISHCKSAGIDVVMMTGDHRLTAETIAKEIGIAEKGDQGMSGEELEKIDVKDLEKKIEKIKVFARVSPEHKDKIVRALKNKGHIVTMTGDGINDAPALKEADIGVAMGITGTQVTKEASSVILADDNFASIISAVKEGRKVMDNVRKYLVFLLCANIGVVIFLTFSIIMGWPLPLLAKHILYINLATNGSPAIALGLEPAEPDIMKRKPHPPKESIFKNTLPWFVGVSILIGSLSVLLFWYVLETNDWSEFALNKARTMLFGFIIIQAIIFALSCRSLRHHLPTLGFFKNKILIYSLIGETCLVLLIMNYPPLMGVFGLVQLEQSDWLLILVLAPIIFIYSEVLKVFLRIKNKHKIS